MGKSFIACALAHAAYFGAVPDQHSSGNQIRLGRMSRRGDRYLRSLLINGAHAVIRQTRSDSTDPDRLRILRWKQCHGSKVAAVRLANHNLRVIYAWLRDQAVYHKPEPVAS